ncbi:sensor histidine kinase [Paraconexibacter algicola]|uniref:histidine kinase n=1 Tax=Paraconexibacter algicola TaxID=2133960 RepID=A0A2T4UEV4_9ACTN|nr:ATP-binding protein [Paraconexibacter algicola]PTL56316.1 hypothetical protein C7Y72_15185 [Paraconexibacter algicola]
MSRSGRPQDLRWAARRLLRDVSRAVRRPPAPTGPARAPMGDPVLAALRVRTILTGAPVFLALFLLFLVTSPTPVRVLPALLIAGTIILGPLAIGVQHVRHGPYPRNRAYQSAAVGFTVAAGAAIAALGPGPSTAFSVTMSFGVITLIVLALDGRWLAGAALGHAAAWLGTGWLLNDPGTDALLTGAVVQGGALTVLLLAGRIFSDHVLVAATANEAARRAQAEAELARVQERQRLSEALHDHALQLVVTALQDLAEAETDDPAVLEAHQRIDDAVRALRGLSVTMNEGLLAELAPRVALEYVVAEARGDGRLEIDLDVEPDVHRRHTVLLVESARELLANVRRHANASRATVRVALRDGELELAVEDDGVGFDEAAVAAAGDAGHVGIWRLRRHARVLGGAFTLSRRPGGGTRAALRVRDRR